MRTGSFLTYRGPGRISIAQYQPKWLEPAPQLRRLAPRWSIFKLSGRAFVDGYRAQLAKVDARAAWDALHERADGDPVLLCWERAPFSCPCGWWHGDPADDGKLDLSNWCHRSIVAEWFSDKLGEEVLEVEAKARGTWAHRNQLPLF